ncbi:hypothetical protein [Brevundimonas sp. Root1279]|uniref:hypothetical protein n=1 Tax=Brevundimonas sp. Root1279 TaxID=1736443 RepID=UPI0006F74E2E|nr:hypothetical protein [Brevundimonas sp. Root1279]KQW86664.1 hypothetical protein ASC65_01885 [Brevundimonas sp. Root1279]
MTPASPLFPLTPLGVGPVYEGVHIWLPQLFAEHMQAGQSVIEGKTFDNCRFEGPAVLLPLSGCSFQACNMGEAGGDTRNLLLAPVGAAKVVGVIPVRDCIFRGSAFYMVGFTGSSAFLKQFHQMVGGPTL